MRERALITAEVMNSVEINPSLLNDEEILDKVFKKY